MLSRGEELGAGGGWVGFAISEEETTAERCRIYIKRSSFVAGEYEFQSLYHLERGSCGRKNLLFCYR